MKWIPVALLLFLSACSSTPQKTYYQLPALGVPAQVSSNGVSARQLWLEHISVADYLAQNGVVYQTNDVRYVIAQNNLWASSLDQQAATDAGHQPEQCAAGVGGVHPSR